MVKRHTLLAHKSFPDLPGEVVAASDYDALATRLAEAQRKLPCGHHHSMDDSYGGCVLCTTMHHYTEAETRLAEAERLILRMSGEGYQRATLYVEEYDLTGERAADSADAAHEKIAKFNATPQLWVESHAHPPPEAPEFVLVAFASGDPPVVEVTRAEYVRAYPDEYPWWMPLPNAPTVTVTPASAPAVCVECDGTGFFRFGADHDRAGQPCTVCSASAARPGEAAKRDNPAMRARLGEFAGEQIKASDSAPVGTVSMEVTTSSGVEGSGLSRHAASTPNSACGVPPAGADPTPDAALTESAFIAPSSPSPDIERALRVLSEIDGHLMNAKYDEGGTARKKIRQVARYLRPTATVPAVQEGKP